MWNVFTLLCFLHSAYQIDLFLSFIISVQHGSQHISAIRMSHSFSGQSFRIGSVCESFSELNFSSLLERFMFCIFFFRSISNGGVWPDGIPASSIRAAAELNGQRNKLYFQFLLMKESADIEQVVHFFFITPSKMFFIGLCPLINNPLKMLESTGHPWISSTEQMIRCETV